MNEEEKNTEEQKDPTDTLLERLGGYIDQRLEEKAPEEEPNEEKRDINPNGGEEVDARVETGELEGEHQMAHNTLRLLNGIATGQHRMIEEAQQNLARGGHYGEEAQQAVQRAAGDYYSTLVDADGAHLLPTAVANTIEEIAEEYGAARQAASTFNHVTGTIKVPGATGNLRASAVAEGGTISSSMRQFKAIELNPAKWALIVPWTYEANLEIGPQILADANRAIARGFARAEDDAMINGDRTSTYNSIDGLFSSNRSSVAEYTLPSGSTAFSDFGADDAFKLRNKIAPSVRGNGAYVFHPDMETYLRILKDANNQYIYAYESDQGRPTLGGRPVYYSEVLPDESQSAVSTTFGVYGDFSFWRFAVGQGMTSENLREAQVQDADTGSTINLATQDMRALKVRELFDMDTNFEDAFVKITTAAS